MTLPESEKNLAEQALARYCEGKAPAQVKNNLKIGYSFRGNSFTLFEMRPSFVKPGKTTATFVSQFRYNVVEKTWVLYSVDKDSRWNRYEDLAPSKSIQTLIDEVDADPNNIFWG
jgi:hypothetical protein